MTRSSRFILEAPYWDEGTQPFESKQRLTRRLKEHAPEFYEQMWNWRKLRQRDLVEIDGLEPKAAERRSWTEVSLLYPPPGVQAKRPVARIVALPDPPKPKVQPPDPIQAKQQGERLRRLAQGIAKITPEAVAAEEVKYLDDKLFEDPAWAIGNPEEFIRDVIFVYNNVQRRCKPESAPSPGAWTLLLYARENGDKFFTNLWPKALDFQQKLTAAKLQHERELKKLEIEAELEAHRQNQMSDEEAADLAETLDLCKELGLPVREVAKGIRLTKEPPPELAAQLEL